MRQHPVTIKGIDIFETAFEHSKIEVSVLHYDIEYEEDELKDKKIVIYSVRAPSIDLVKHWVSLLYEPANLI